MKFQSFDSVRNQGKEVLDILIFQRDATEVDFDIFKGGRKWGSE